MKKNENLLRLKIFGRKRTGKKGTSMADSLKLDFDNFQGIGKRHRQEDSFYVADYNDSVAIAEKGFMAVVADGMGGMLNGAEMSAVVTSTAKEYYDKHLSKKVGKEPQELCSMLALIDARAKQMQEQTDEEESGSTLLSVLIRGHKLYFLTVGDSRIYLLREGKLLQLNREHNVKSQMIERVAKEELDMEFYREMTGKAGLTSYIGVPELEMYELSYKPFVLQKHDVILLASDGVFGTLQEEKMIEILEEDFGNAAKKMRDAVERAGNPRQDNYTGVMIKCI